jgi:hypothetical protein
MPLLRRRGPIRAVIFIGILLSGLALLPLAGTAARPLRWQLFANGYEPVLTINHTVGRPGSFFSLIASGYPPDRVATIRVSSSLGTFTVGHMLTGPTGTFRFKLATVGGTPGVYVVIVSVDDVTSATTSFTLDNAAPRWPPEGPGPAFHIFNRRYFPAVLRTP